MPSSSPPSTRVRMRFGRRPGLRWLPSSLEDTGWCRRFLQPPMLRTRPRSVAIRTMRRPRPRRAARSKRSRAAFWSIGGQVAAMPLRRRPTSPNSSLIAVLAAAIGASVDLSVNLGLGVLGSHRTGRLATIRRHVVPAVAGRFGRGAHDHAGPGPLGNGPATIVRSSRRFWNWPRFSRRRAQSGRSPSAN